MYIKNKIETIYQELIMYENNEYKKLYLSFENEKLITVFSTLHHIFVEKTREINDRLLVRNYYVLADTKKQLIKATKSLEELKSELKSTRYSFSVDKEYQMTIKLINNFLSSGDNNLPEDTKKIEIYYEIPIFISDDTISIDSQQSDRRLKRTLIGEGSYATVSKYKDDYYNKYYAIKTAKKDLKDEELQRFKIEYETLNKFSSPYIIEVYKYIEDKNEYIMEYMDINLYDYIQKNNNKLSKSKRKKIILQILKGMKVIHSKKLLHRDINPDNILIKYYEDVKIIKIADFGLIKDPENEMTKLKTEIKGWFNDYDNLSRVGFHKYSMIHETFAITKVIVYVLTGKTNQYNIEDKNLIDFLNKGTDTNTDNRFKSVDEIHYYLEEKITNFNQS